MRDLLLVVPSRQRPHNIARLLDCMDRTCRADTALVVGVDDDDPALGDYRGLGAELVVLSGFQGQLVRWLNRLSARAGFRAVGHIGDDNTLDTVGWDARVMESLERNLFCFGNDLDPGRPQGSLSIHIFMQSRVVRTLGYMGPPEIQHMYVDPVWFAWGTATSIEFLRDVEIPHHHYSLGRSPVDESYGRSTGLIPRDCAAYNRYCDERLNDDIAKLGGTPFTEEGLAEFNRRLNIPRVWGEPVG
jgi:hypothetical protein